MPKYRVLVVRTEWREHEFTVEQATDEDDARQQALEQARNFDFDEGKSVGYMTEVADRYGAIKEMA